MRKTLKTQNLNRLLCQIEYCRKGKIDVKFEANVKMKLFVLFCLTNSSLQFTSSKCWNISLIAYLLCLVDVCLYKESEFLWILTVPNFLVDLFLYSWEAGDSQEKRKETTHILWFYVQLYRWCFFLLNISKLCDYVDRIYHIEPELYYNVWLISWSMYRYS